MRLGVSILLAFLLMTVAVQADENEYIEKYFGTVAVFTVDNPITDPEDYGYWAEQLPSEVYDSDFLFRTATASLKSSGLPELPADFYLYAIPGELEASQGYRYTLSFERCRPTEVNAILAGLDNLSTVFPDAELTFLPLTSRFFDCSNMDVDEALEFDQSGVKLSFAPGASSRSMHQALLASFRQRYGEQTELDSFYYSESIYYDSSSSRALSFQVNVAPDSGLAGEDYDG